MELWKAEQYAIKKMKEFGLLEQGWKFAFNNRKRTNGYCEWDKKVISLSRLNTSIREDKNVITTILHEIAHALTPYHYHDRTWKSKCHELGIKGDRIATDTVDKSKKEYKHIYICKNCGKEFGTYRILKNISRRYHTTCHNKGIARDNCRLEKIK